MEQITCTVIGTKSHRLYVNVQFKQLFAPYSQSTKMFIMQHNELLEPLVNNKSALPTNILMLFAHHQF
jgi:hypothetical protein